MIRSSPFNVIRNWLMLSLLLLPGAIMLVGARQDISPQEARKLAGRPVPADLARQPFRYASLWDSYLEDHFGLRQSYLDINSWIRSSLSAPASNHAIVGKDGWLFFDEGLLNDSRDDRITSRKVARQVRLIDAISRRLGRRGIPLIVIPAPDKHSVYPENLPDWLSQRSDDHAMDRLISGLRSKKINVVDVRDIFASQKVSQPVYFRTDTHWTTIGAAIAFNAVAEHSSELVKPVKVPANARLAPGTPHDLARMARFGHDSLDWVVSTFTSSYPTREQDDLDFTGNDSQRPYVLRRKGPGTSALIIGDSFSAHWPVYSLESANVVFWSHHNQCRADWTKLLNLDVDLVIYEVVERAIGCPPIGPKVMASIRGPTPDRLQDRPTAGGD